MRLASVVLAVVGLALVGGCRGTGGAGARGLQRPADVGPEWNWAAEALPTGDVSTSVITIEKFVPADLSADSDYSHTVRVTNISTGALHDVVLSDALPPSGYTLVGAEPEPERAGDVLRWKVGTMAPGQSYAVSVKGHIHAEAGRASTCATVSYVKPEVPKPVTPPPPVLVAKLELAKSMTADSCVFDEIPIKLVLKNAGNGKATDVKVVDQLPEGLTVNGQKSVTFNVGELAAGASKELTAKARAARPGKYKNTATATAAGGLKAEASADVNVWKAVLAITKTSSAETLMLGRETTFTITVKNAGDRPAADCTVRDTMSGADAIRGASDGGAVAGATVTWKLGDMAPGASKTVTVKAVRGTPGAIEDTATATARCADPVSASARTTYRGIPSVMVEVVDDPDPIAVGGTTVYTITVTNQGSAPLTGIAVNAELEGGVEFVAAAGASKETVTGGKIAFATIASLDPKKAVRWTVTAKGVKAADSRFHVSVTSKETERPVEETEATRFYE